MLNFGNKEFRNLQEQVLKNAQDIETLKGREDLQIVIVNELPEVGNPNYIYLVAKDDGESPDVYDEYIWLEDEERYEKIGGVSIDLTNYVTVDTAQTITGAKTFTQDLTLYAETGDSPAIVFQRGTTSDNLNDWKIVNTSGYLRFNLRSGNELWISEIELQRDILKPIYDNTVNLGTSSIRWGNLYLGGSIDFGNNAIIKKDTSNRINILYNNTVKIKVGNTETYFANNVTPDSNNTYDLGTSSLAWKGLYLSGNITDGVNSVTVANIASKVTSTFASGTFDANGESTIDISSGTPEGLFIFTYGNCQCFVRLTATMVQNADAVPINVSCPMIHNNTVSLGWLQFYRSSDTLTITVTDGNNHVDSGYAWTLTKTNLI